MSEVEIIVTGKNLAKAAFASADADVKVISKSAEDLALSLRRAELAASSAGATAERSMGAASKASEKAAASAKAAADAQEQLARGVGSAEYAAKAEATAQADLAAATEKATRAALAAERAQIAQASAANKAKVAQEEAAAASVKSSGAMAAGMEKLRNVGKTALEGVVVGTAAVGYEATKMAMNWQKSMVVLVTSAGESGSLVHNKLVGPIKQVSDGLMKMSGDTATSMDELAKAMYFVESAGFHGAEGLKVMKAAAQGAKAENADAETVTKALTDVLVDYHMKASDAANVTSQMISAISHGKTNLQDFSGAFANIVPAASAAGISFKDVASALAQMTNHGFTADRASQNLAQALRSLLNPTNKMQESFKEYGVSAAELKAKLHGPNGLTDAMQYLSQAASKAGKEGTPEFAAALKMLMGTAPGANAALTTVGANFKATSDTIRDVGRASADGAGNVKGFAEVQKTLSFQVTQVVDKLKAFVAQVGMALIPVLSDALGWLSKHTTVLKVLAGIVGGVLLVAIVAYTASMVSAAAATIAATWPILAVIAAVAALVIGFKLLYDHSKGFRDFVQVMWEGIKVIWDQAKKHWDLIVVGIVGPLGLLVVYFRHHTDQLKKIWSEVWAGLQKAWKGFENGPLKDIQHGIDNVRAWWKKNGEEIIADVKVAWKVISAEISVAMTLIVSSVKFGWTMLVSWLRLMWGILRDAAKLVWQLISDIVTGAMHTIRNVVQLVLDIIHGRWGKVWGDLKKMVSDGLNDSINLIKHLTSNFGTLLWDAGKNLIKGLIDGIKSAFGGLKDTVSNLASQVRGFFPFSPAKEGPLSGEGSLDKAGVKMTSMLADGMTSGTSMVRAAASRVAEAAGHHHRHRGHHQQTIGQQLTHLAHNEGHMSTAALDKAVEKIMHDHRLSIAQLSKSMQILLAKGGHHTSMSKIDSLIAAMKKQFKGLTSKEILDAAIKELEHHPHLNTGQLMSRVAKDLHAQARKTAGSAAAGGDGQTGYIGDLSWQAAGVRYTVGGAGRSTGPGGSAAGGTSGSTSVAAGGSSGQHLTIGFAPMHVEIDLKDTGGVFSPAQVKALQKAVRVRGGNVQKVLGS